MKERKFFWFIEPLDSYTNEVISRELPEENFMREIKISDGSFKNLWTCSSSLLSNFNRSKVANNLKFRIYSKEGEGKIRECTFLFKKKRKVKSPQ